MEAPRALPRVVIVGCGFAGLAAARGLAGAPCTVTVIDRRNYHLFQPLLYQVATAALSPADIAWPIRSLLRGRPELEVRLGRVAGVDPDRRRVLLEEGEPVPYDWLVLATGARHSYLGRDDWETVAPGLKKIDDATAIRERVLLAFERAEIEPDPAARTRLSTFVVVGGGPTGVEMAGALAELARHALAADFRRIDTRRTRVVLVEAGPRVLPAFPPALSAAAAAALVRLGVELRLGRPVTGCDGLGVVLGGEERIEARTIVWGAGVIASPAARWLDAPADRAGRLRVLDDLSVPGRPEVFAVGDTAAATSNGAPVPGTAPAAKQMGAHVARLIRARLAGDRSPRPFRYRHYGDLATIGRRAAVAALGPVRLSGLPAWLLWATAHLWFLIGWRNRLVVALSWAWAYLTGQRGARLITGATGAAPAAAAPPTACPRSAA